MYIYIYTHTYILYIYIYSYACLFICLWRRLGGGPVALHPSPWSLIFPSRGARLQCTWLSVVSLIHLCLFIDCVCSAHAWMHECMDAWMHGCMDAWMHGCMDAWMHGCTDACADARTHGFANARMRWCTDAWTRECVDVWICMSAAGAARSRGAANHKLAAPRSGSQPSSDDSAWTALASYFVW